MTAVLALLVGVLFTTGTYLLLQRALTRVIIGLALLGHGANLLLLLAGGSAGAPPLVADGDVRPPGAFADPLPQALALTAIVISFGVLAFLLTLAYRSWVLHGEDEVEDDVEDRRIARLAARTGRPRARPGPRPVRSDPPDPRTPRTPGPGTSGPSGTPGRNGSGS